MFKLVIITLVPFVLSAASFPDMLKDLDTSKGNLGLKRPNQIFENLNIRVSKDENEDKGFSNDEFEYSLRFKPVTIGSSELRSRYFKNQQSRLKVIGAQYKSNLVTNLYNEYLGQVFILDEKEKREKLSLVLEDKVNVLKALLKRGEEKIGSLIKAEKKLFENTLRLDAIRKTLARSKNKFSPADIKSFKGLDEIKKYISKMDITKFDSIKLGELELEKSNMDLTLELDKRNKVFDFVELKVDKREIDNNQYDNRMGIRFSFNIPSLKNENLAINEEKIKLIYAKSKAAVELSEINSELEEQKETLLSEVSSLNMILNSSFYKNSKKYLALYSNQRGASPLKLVELNESVLDANIEVLELKLNIYTNYINLLALNGDISKNPKRNYLVESAI